MVLEGAQSSCHRTLHRPLAFLLPAAKPPVPPRRSPPAGPGLFPADRLVFFYKLCQESFS